MVKLKISFISVILGLILYSCNENSKYFKSSKDAIEDVKDRFPTLIYSSNKNIKEVSTRKISIENDGVEINLIEFEGDDDNNKILVFKNKENHYYSIPIFSTIHRDYWNFQNDLILKQISSVNSTFKKEFLKMMNILKFNSKHDFWNIYVETFKNVLLWDFIETKEELKRHYNRINTNNSILIQNEDSKKSEERINKNIKSLENSFKNHETYLLYGNGMIIEFSDIHNYIFKKRELEIKCYRQDMNMQKIYL